MDGSPAAGCHHKLCRERAFPSQDADQDVEPVTPDPPRMAADVRKLQPGVVGGRRAVGPAVDGGAGHGGGGTGAGRALGGELDGEPY
jgi:hypothetical protein